MTYHLARVLHWQQDRSVALYATNIERQLHLTPGGEYGILRLDLLSGGDRLDNLPQWLAAMGSLPVVSLIPARLDATARGQALAAVFCATLPMGILQSSSTQNDYQVAYWLACLVAWSSGPTGPAGRGRWPSAPPWGWRPSPRPPPTCSPCPSSSCWRYACSGTPAASAGWPPWRRLPEWSRSASTPGSSRNQDLYGTPFGPDGEGAPHEIKYLNAAFGGPQLASNLLRNSTLQVATPVGSVNRAMERSVDRVHQTLGIDPNDPGTTYGQTRYSVRQTSNGEDTAGNPLHVALLVTVAAVGASGGWRHSPPAPYLLCLVAGFLLFSLLLRGSRGTAG
jgi:hypothetical protein